MKKRFILHALKVQNLTHIPGAYYTSLTTRNAITFYFKHVPRVVLKEGSSANYAYDVIMTSYIMIHNDKIMHVDNTIDFEPRKGSL